MSRTTALVILEMNSPSSSQLWILTSGQAFVPGTVLINEKADLIDCAADEDVSIRLTH